MKRRQARKILNRIRRWPHYRFGTLRLAARMLKTGLVWPVYWKPKKGRVR